MYKTFILFSILSLMFINSSATALMWNDPGVIPVQSISDHRWRDANTGRLINVTGMPNVNPTPTPASTPTPATTSSPTRTPSPATASSPTPTPTPATTSTPTPTPGPAPAPSGTTTSAPTPGPAPAPSGPTTSAPTPTPGPAPAPSGPTTSAPSTTAPKPRTNWSSMSRGAKAGAALGIAGGVAGVYASTAGQGEHSGWNVAGGAASGAIAGASVGSIFPVIGTGIGAAAGAIIGGLISGSQVFSETDCLYDPVTGAFTCCNTVFNKGERQANIGDYMFCGVEQNGTNVIAAPGVRQCLQGKKKDESTWSDTAAGWWDGLWKDDFWQPECVARYCTESGEPAKGIEAYIEYIPDTTNYCWNWGCISGYTRSGNTCVVASTNQPVNPYTTPENPTTNQYDELINRLQNLRQNLVNRCGYMLGN